MEMKPVLQQRRWLVPLLASLLLISAAIFSSSPSFSHRTLTFLSMSQICAGTNAEESLFVEPKLRLPPQSETPVNPMRRLAYLISDSAGDGGSIRRTLRSLYYSANRYVVHLDLEASPAERMELAVAVRDDPTYARFRNIRVILHSNLVTYRGPTMAANTLHAAAILLKEAGD